MSKIKALNSEYMLNDEKTGLFFQVDILRNGPNVLMLDLYSIKSSITPNIYSSGEITYIKDKKMTNIHLATDKTGIDYISLLNGQINSLVLEGHTKLKQNKSTLITNIAQLLQKDTNIAFEQFKQSLDVLTAPQNILSFGTKRKALPKIYN